MFKFPAKELSTYIALLICFLSSTSNVLGFATSSDSYELEGEFGMFGEAKSSANYRLTDTGGGLGPGIGTSSNYRNCSGFQCVIAEVPSIVVSLSSNSINLGTLTTGAVNTGSHTVSVTTNVGGYTTRVYEDGNLRRAGGADIDDVVDGFINAGTEEYGLATSQAGREITQDTDCSASTYAASGVTQAPQSVASKSGPTYTAETTTICYAASRAGLTAAGTFQQLVYFITTGAF